MNGERLPSPGWRLARVTDYWDQQVQAIDRHARLLESLPPDRLSRELAAITDAVARHGSLLSDAHLAWAAVAMADDLYKAVSVLNRWDPSIGSYLQASAGCFLELLSSRGMVLQYVVDNQFESTDTGMAGPLEWYHVWFRAAGFVYICPQHAASVLMEADRHPADSWGRLLSQYIEGNRSGPGQLSECGKCRGCRERLTYR